jgi:hypothetical protein
MGAQLLHFTRVYVKFKGGRVICWHCRFDVLRFCQTFDRVRNIRHARGISLVGGEGELGRQIFDKDRIRDYWSFRRVDILAYDDTENCPVCQIFRYF